MLLAEKLVLLFSFTVGLQTSSNSSVAFSRQKKQHISGGIDRYESRSQQEGKLMKIMISSFRNLLVNRGIKIKTDPPGECLSM